MTQRQSLDMGIPVAESHCGTVKHHKVRFLCNSTVVFAATHVGIVALLVEIRESMCLLLRSAALLTGTGFTFADSAYVDSESTRCW